MLTNEPSVYAEAALRAAFEFDILKTHLNHKHGIKFVIDKLREAYPIDGSIMSNTVSTSDIVFIYNLLLEFGMDKKQLENVSDVLKEVNDIIDQIEAAWNNQQYDKKLVDFLLALSKKAASVHYEKIYAGSR